MPTPSDPSGELPPIPSTSPKELERIIAAAAGSAVEWGRVGSQRRADALEAIADELESSRPDLIALAHRETHLTEPRLSTELTRTTLQLRFFAGLVRDGYELQAGAESPDPSWMGGLGRPQLHRARRPLGPVLVFSASNFPFAFGVAGGDTGSALAAGCPVVVKAHSGHPHLSRATAECIARALHRAGAPTGVFSVIFGTETGVAALEDSRIAASAFTGSTDIGRRLFDIAQSRPVPIPFYGELGSSNPVYVTVSADRARGPEIAETLIGSFTSSAGQLCTKPGLVFAPVGGELVRALRNAELPPGAPLLNRRVQFGFTERLGELLAHPAVTLLRQGTHESPESPQPVIAAVALPDFLAGLEELRGECFGPFVLIIEYGDETELVGAAAAQEGQLTASIFGEDEDEVTELIEAASDTAGRVLWNQWPTGVSVAHIQHHGGPYPATTSPLFTAVGADAMLRFSRPVVYQGFATQHLPHRLREASTSGTEKE